MSKSIIITEEMYLAAKSIVSASEASDVDENPDNESGADKEMEDKYMNPDKPCCNLVHLFIDNQKKGLYNSDLFRLYPRNKKLKYRPDGTIHHDPDSRIPHFCDYNAAREVIRVAKENGHNHAHFRTSVAVAEELKKDGYMDHYNKYNGLITWTTKKPWWRR